MKARVRMPSRVEQVIGAPIQREGNNRAHREHQRHENFSELIPVHMALYDARDRNVPAPLSRAGSALIAIREVYEMVKQHDQARHDRNHQKGEANESRERYDHVNYFSPHKGLI
jgi:hypothetical protein